ncbi:hypothetical protein DYB32_010049 [Aphanomyces invadans]|uniref:Uncharacterized protein n=1 Tax=Aphanomyces invadans TaxID=157072 RepID=A0A3R6Y0T1_9STRA|nr:hypothetical protein DYB32_010049 [Aphanomyces invadans]
MLDQVTTTTKPRWREPAIDFVAGSLGGFCAKFVEFPLDTVKVLHSLMFMQVSLSLRNRSNFKRKRRVEAVEGA